MPKKKTKRRLKLQEQASRTEFLEKVKRYPIAKGKEILVNPTDRDKRRDRRFHDFLEADLVIGHEDHNETLTWPAENSM